MNRDKTRTDNGKIIFPFKYYYLLLLLSPINSVQSINSVLFNILQYSLLGNIKDFKQPSITRGLKDPYPKFI